jgi:O-antigen/teichoic acid export membrane protein
METGRRSGTFSDRVMVVFLTQVFVAGVGVINGFLMARLLGPAAKGEYYLLVLVPATAMVLIQLGLPQAFGFFAARGQAFGIVAKTVVLAALLSLGAFLVVLVLMPFLRETIFHGVGLEQILFAFLALPLLLNATFTTGIVMGRQAVRWYAVTNSTYTVATTFLLVLFLGRLGLAVNGAIAVYLIASTIQTTGFLVGAARITAAIERPQPVSYRKLFGYGLPFYPGSVTQFFSYRADVYLIAGLLANPATPLGYYSMAVGLAELVFFFPNAVSTLFFPHVAGSSREDSDRQVPVVTRVTLLLTTAVAILLVPVATLMIWVFLPAFGPSLPALFVLLPGVVALCATKVVTGYVSGLGMTAVSSYVNSGAFVLNILVNLVLIPRFGILGAAAASLISYTASSVVFTAIAARLAHVRVIDFWLPRRSDLRFTVTTSATLVRRVLGGVAARI